MAREDQPRRRPDRSAHWPVRPTLALGVALVSSALISGLSIHQPGAIPGLFRAAAPAGHTAQAADIARSAPGQVPVPADVGRATGTGLEAMPPAVAGPPL